MNLHEWLVSQGYGQFADNLNCLENLEYLKSAAPAMLCQLSGIDIDQARRLIEVAGNWLEEDKNAKQAAQSTGLSTLLARLPVFLASPYDELVHEQHPRIKLHRLFDVAELVIRWSSAVLLSIVRERHNGILPEELLDKLRKLIEKPSMGSWVAIFRATCEACPQAGMIPTPLARWVRWVGVATTKKNIVNIVGDEFTPDRNILAHSGGGSVKFCLETYQKHGQRFEQLINGVAAQLDDLDVIGIHGEQVDNLKGLVPTAIPLEKRPANLTDAPSGVWLLGADNFKLELWPLIRHERLRTANSGTDDKRPHVTGRATPQCYISTKKGKTLAYLPIGTDELCSYIDDAKFRTFFLLDHLQADTPLRRRFIELIKVESESLVGREMEIGQIHAWLQAANHQPDNPPRLGIIFGGPGLGKSILMARTVADLDTSAKGQGAAADAWYFHRFRRGMDGNTPNDFYAGLLDTLQNSSPLKRKLTEEIRAADHHQKTLLQRVGEQLARIGSLAPKSRLLIIIDGLDEVAYAHADFPAEIQKLAVPGTTWLIASREEYIPQQLIDHGERVIAPALGPLSAYGIRAMLEKSPPAVKYALIKRDNDNQGDDERPPDNPFVKGVVDKAKGNPLYVHFLAQDLESGTYAVTNERQLPRGLVKYYTDLMKRKGVTDVGRTLPLLVALLACAEEPFSRESLCLLCKKSSNVIDDVVLSAQGMLRFALTPDGKEGFTLYHTNVRDYLLNKDDNPLYETISEAREILITIASTSIPLESAGPLAGYLARHGVAHLLVADKLAEAINLLDHLQQRADKQNHLPRGYLSEATKKVVLALQERLEMWSSPRLSATRRAELGDSVRGIAPHTLANIFAETYETGVYSAGIRFLIEFHSRDWWDNKGNIKNKFLTPYDLVARHSVGEALSDVFLAAGLHAQDDSLTESQKELLGRIKAMAVSANIEECEAAGYALQEIFEEIPGLIDDNLISRWAGSDVGMERMLLGELLISFAHAGKTDFDQRIHSDRFWVPIWEYHLIDIEDFYVLTKKAPPEGRRIDAVRLERSAREHKATRDLLTRLLDEPYVQEAGEQNQTLSALLSGYDELNTSDPLVRKSAVQAINAALNDTPKTRSLAKNVIKVLASHSLWAVGESCSSIVADIVAADHRHLSLLAELLAEPGSYWRIRYCMVDAAFNVRELDDFELFYRAFLDNYQHKNSRVRGICFDDFFACVRLSDKVQREALLDEFKPELLNAVKDARDCWELEYLYLLFNFLDLEGFRVKEWLAENHGVARYFGDIEAKPFYKLGRKEFLMQIDAIRQKEMQARASKEQVDDN